MDLRIDPRWLLRMAESEANGIVSVGGLVTRIMLGEREDDADIDLDLDDDDWLDDDEPDTDD